MIKNIAVRFAACAAFALAASETLPAAELAHRWSFNGDPFVRPDGVNPVISPNKKTGFDFPTPETLTNLTKRAWGVLEGNIVAESSAQWAPLRGVVPSAAHFHGIWNWDAAFHTLAFVRRDAQLARDQFRIMMKYQGEDGMFPDVVRQNARQGVFRGCTKPPVWAWAIWTMERTAPDAVFLREAYDALVREESFWRMKRLDTAIGLFHYDGNAENEKQRVQYAGWESGWDNSPRWDGNPSAIIPVDLNCYFVLRYSALRDIAAKLNLPLDAARWDADAKALAARIEEKLWDEESGCYYDWDVGKGDFSRVLTPASFMPLFIGTATDARAAALARQSRRMQPGWPTVAYSDPKFDPVGYWRGRTWLNVAYFALKGLKFYGYDEIADDGRRTLLGWVESGRETIYENYNPTTGEPVGCPKFGWSAVFTLKFIDDWDMPRVIEMPIVRVTRSRRQDG